MDSEHNAIHQLMSKLDDESEFNNVILQELKKRFMRHFTWEEQVLFPEFEKKAGSSGKGIVFLLKGEHEQIQNLLKKITKQIDTTTMSNTMSDLIEIIKKHKFKEYEIFYPWFEKNLNVQEIDQLIERMKNIYLLDIDHK